MRPLLASVALLGLVAYLAAGCLPSGLRMRAGDHLHAHHRTLVYQGVDRVGDADVYTFCRQERGRNALFATPARAYDAACVMYICRPGTPAAQCDETPM